MAYNLFPLIKPLASFISAKKLQFKFDALGFVLYVYQKQKHNPLLV